jgi:hypothetical protein
MTNRIYHGTLSPQTFANALLAKFNRGNLRTQQVGQGDQVVVQIATRQGAGSGGQTALSVSLQKVADGVSVQIGKQAWFGTAASLGFTALSALRNPMALLGRLDDLAQDFENLQMVDSVWGTIAETARTAGASFELSERLRRSVCSYCNTPNAVGEAACLACGAPLGDSQPVTCQHCGFVLAKSEHVCPNCGK